MTDMGAPGGEMPHENADGHTRPRGTRRLDDAGVLLGVVVALVRANEVVAMSLTRPQWFLLFAGRW